MPLLDHFDLIAPFYDRAVPLKSSEIITGLVNCPVSGKLLDAGGGTGRVSSAFIGKCADIVVSDVSLAMLRQAKAKDAFRLACAQTECLPFQGDAFERVIMVDAFHHVCNHSETASELWRVLKPGGRIVIQEPDINTFAVKLVALLEKLLLMRSHFISAERIAAYFNYHNASINIHRDGYNTWMVIDKS